MLKIIAQNTLLFLYIEKIKVKHATLATKNNREKHLDIF